MQTKELEVDITKVRPNSFNPKDDIAVNQKAFSRVGKSLAAHGQLEPLLVREVSGGYEIVNGFHRYKHLLAFGAETIQVISLGKINDDKAKAIALATEDANVPIDRILAAKLVAELLEESAANISEIPYDEQDAKAMAALADFDWTDAPIEHETEQEANTPKKRLVTIPEHRKDDWDALLMNLGHNSDVGLLIDLLDSYEDANDSN